MDVSSFESNFPSGSRPKSVANLADPAFAGQQFPDLAIKHLITRFILARGAVVRATNPGLAEEYVKLASVFYWDEPSIGRRVEAWSKGQTPAA